MKALAIYDSMYGNTEKIAQAIGGAITGDVKVLHASEVNALELEPVSPSALRCYTDAFSV